MTIKYTGSLKSGEQLYELDTLTSTDGVLQLELQKDGDLVLSKIITKDKKDTKTTVWSAGLKGQKSVKAAMETDGRFVVYDQDKKELWNSGTKEHTGAVLSFSTDERLIVKQESNILWQSTKIYHWILPSDSELLADDCLLSPSGKVKLILQKSDGNLVLYYTNCDDTNDALWSSSTDGKPSIKAHMQTDGNFVIYDSKGGDLWNSHTNGQNASSLFCQDDGVLFINNYKTVNTIWSS